LRQVPGSVTRAKRLLTSAAAAGVDADLERAILENARIRCTPDFKEGLASFLEKRKPLWRGDQIELSFDTLSGSRKHRDIR